MKKFFSFFMLFALASGCFAQRPQPDYLLHAKKADSLFRLKDYSAAGAAYSAAFRTAGNKGYVNDRYNAARAWAMAGVPDSAFDCLEKIIKKRYFSNYDSLTKEKDFAPLHGDYRWAKLESTVKLYADYKVPKGWFISGPLEDRDKYLIGVEKGAGYESKNAMTIKSTEKEIKSFGNVMQNFLPDKYSNKRIRLSGFMKTKDVAEWAGLWLRIEQAGSATPLAFDNMKDGKTNRSIKGTTEWKKYEIVLDVPERATNIAFGAMLDGTGQIWFDGLKFEIVDKSVPVTGKDMGTEPVNLDFEE